MYKTLRVLIVEDSDPDPALLRGHLSYAGFEVIADQVETPAEMKAALEAKEWDVILFDDLLPRFNVLAALALLKEMALDIPFIVISGIAGESVAVEAMRAGAHDYLMKDDLVRLAPTIERELHEAENRRARRRAETELKASEMELRAIFEAITDVILVLDAEGRYLKIASTNPAYLYKPSDDLIGKTLYEVFPKEDADFFLEHIHLALRAGRIHRIEYHLQIEEAEVWFDGSVSPLSKDLVVWIARDITQRKQAEEALRQSDEQLRQSDKLESIGKFAGRIAHDFNNLLLVITGYSELLLRRLQSEDPLRRNLEEIKKAGDRAVALSRQLLAFSRKQILQPKVLNLNSIVSDLEKKIRGQITENVELRTEFDSALGSIKADQGQIEQVIMNLVVNARDSMFDGGKLIIETKNVFLNKEYTYDHVAFDSGQYVMLAITDTGIGIDSKTQKHIFEPFFTTQELGKGTGLDLSTVYGIVKQSGGIIRVYSELGQGTSFKIFLPRLDEVAEDYKQGAKDE
jgi:two-component system cell cycle sensor histidine kinase/response regulator CckA